MALDAHPSPQSTPPVRVKVITSASINTISVGRTEILFFGCGSGFSYLSIVDFLAYSWFLMEFTLLCRLDLARATNVTVLFF